MEREIYSALAGDYQAFETASKICQRKEDWSTLLKVCVECAHTAKKEGILYTSSLPPTVRNIEPLFWVAVSKLGYKIVNPPNWVHGGSFRLFLHHRNFRRERFHGLFIQLLSALIKGDVNLTNSCCHKLKFDPPPGRQIEWANRADSSSYLMYNRGMGISLGLVERVSPEWVRWLESCGCTVQNDLDDCGRTLYSFDVCQRMTLMSRYYENWVGESDFNALKSQFPDLCKLQFVRALERSNHLYLWNQ